MIAVVRALYLSQVSAAKSTRSVWANHTPPKKSKSASPQPPLHSPLIPSFPRIAHTAGSLILAHGGVVRGLTNWGPYLLTKPVKKNQARHDSGHHFILRFDASPSVQELVKKTVAVDPRMIRCGVVKMGGRLKDIAEVKGVVAWLRNRRGTELTHYMAGY